MYFFVQPEQDKGIGYTWVRGNIIWSPPQQVDLNTQGAIAYFILYGHAPIQTYLTE